MEEGKMIYVQFILLAVTGLYISYRDYKEHIIPNKINILLFICGIFITIWDRNHVLNHILGFFILGILMLLLAVITKGFGMGDVKYLFNVGLILGLVQGMAALIIGFLLGGLVSAILLVLKKVGKKDMIAFGPYLVAGTLLSFFV